MPHAFVCGSYMQKRKLTQHTFLHMQHSIGHRIEIDYGPTCAQRPHARPLEYVGHACMHVHVYAHVWCVA